MTAPLTAPPTGALAAIFSPNAVLAPLVDDISDLVSGDVGSIQIAIGGFLPTDAVQQAVFTAKARLTDSNADVMTIAKTITPTLSADGVLTPTIDPTTWLATIVITQLNSLYLHRQTHVYSLRLQVVRDGVTFERTVLTGSITAQLAAMEVVNVLLDGTYLCDGLVDCNGLTTPES